MLHRVLLCMFLFTLCATLASSAQPAESYNRIGENWDSSYSSDEGGGQSYLGVDIADVSAERLSDLKLKEENGAEVTMVDQDAPAGKGGLHEHDVIVSLNGTAVGSAAQLRRMIKETPPGRVVTLGISRDGQAMTVKVQLADRQKSMAWAPKSGEFKIDIPKMNVPDFDLPVSVVVVHQSARSGLMVENISPQLGDFFGVKGGNGILVRSVEKGSRGEKAGFRAGDVVVRVNDQPVHDTSDFTHALHSSGNHSANVTIMREKREQNLTLPLPEKKDSGSLFEDSLDLHDFTAEMRKTLSEADQLARMSPVFAELEKRFQDRQKEFQDRQRELQDRMQEMQKRQQGLRHGLSAKWFDI